MSCHPCQVYIDKVHRPEKQAIGISLLITLLQA
jgi:hypothetical protein